MFNIYTGLKYHLVQVLFLSIIIFWIGVVIFDTKEPMISYLLSVIVSDLILKSKGKVNP